MLPVEARGLLKRYGHVLAVDGVDLTVHAGDIYGVLDMTRLDVARPGPFAIRAIETPAGIVDALFDRKTRRC